MYCPECGRLNGHDPRCPNNTETEWVIDTCTECGCVIMNTESFYDAEDGAVCVDCAGDYYNELLSRMKARDYVEGEK